jgi:hypothetical protein
MIEKGRYMSPVVASLRLIFAMLLIGRHAPPNGFQKIVAYEIYDCRKLCCAAKTAVTTKNEGWMQCLDPVERCKPLMPAFGVSRFQIWAILIHNAVPGKQYAFLRNPDG